MSETFDTLYGNKGIDTSYEREKVAYRPEVGYSRKQLVQLIRPEVQQSIERARTFTISQNLSEYDELILEVDQMLKDIEARNPSDKMSTLKGYLLENELKNIQEFENSHSSYLDTGDYELYTLLYQMKSSMQTRRDFIDEKFRTQLTTETDIQKIQEAEEKAISEWEYLEAKVMEGYEALAHHDEDDIHPLDSDSLTTNHQDLDYEVLDTMEKQKRNKELLHTSLADTSYIHRNRYFMFLEVIEGAKIMVYQGASLIDNNLKEFILSLQDLGDMTGPKSHLVLQFKKVKDQHNAIKGRMMTIDDEKETFASEKQYMYQQLETKTVEPLKTWLYDQEESISGSLDLFSSYMVDSIKQTRSVYEETLADMLNFYQSEADFYRQQIDFLKNKEQIRRFYRILEDLEDVSQIRTSWVDEYLRVNGYSV